MTLQNRRATQTGKNKEKVSCLWKQGIAQSWIRWAGFTSLGNAKLVPLWCPSPRMCTDSELVCAGSCQQLSKQPKAKNPNNFNFLSRESYNQHKQQKKAPKQHWALLYHLDFDRESLLRILKDRKLKTKTTISVLNYNHDYFCTNYACFYKGRIAEDYHFVCYWVRLSRKVVF